MPEVHIAKHSRKFSDKWPLFPFSKVWKKQGLMVKGQALASSHPTGAQGVVPEKVTEMWNLLNEKAGRLYG